MAQFRPYSPDPDFIRVRDFLVDTYAAFDGPYNWGIERWNYARYFVAPMLGSDGRDPGVPEGALEAIRLWQEHVGLWEQDGRIVGVANIEHPVEWHRGFGEIFVQRHPEHLDLLDGMLAYGEEHFVNPETGQVYILVYEDDVPLLDAVNRRGYVKNEARHGYHMEYAIGDLPPVRLPSGYTLHTVDEERDVERRRELFGRSFDHEEPEDWPSAFAYRELQRAPDYRPENDFFIKAPDGTYAAGGIFWYDAANRVAFLEPLGTRPAYRGQGLARAIFTAGVRKLKAQGATRMPMITPFDALYGSLGFQKMRTFHAWEKTVAGS
jgi:predicted N-acetyltransferase YhbS